MSISVTNHLALLIALIAVSCGQQRVANGGDPIPVPPDRLPFELVVGADSSQTPPRLNDTVNVRAGGTVTLNSRLTWNGKEPVTIYWGRHASENWVQLKIRTPLATVRETSHNSAPLEPARARTSEVVTLQPGDSVSSRLTLGSTLGSSQEFWFHDPGAYELTMSLAIHVVSGDPTRPESWQALGNISAKPIEFLVTAENDGARDRRLIRGRVTDADGRPVPQADVYVHVERTNMASVWIHREFVIFDRAVTDDSGRFAFPGIPAGEPRLMLGVLHRSLPPAQKVVVPDPAVDAQDVDFQLDRARTITGTVVDATGRPLPDVTVSPPTLPGLRTRGSVHADANGRFELHGVTTAAATLQVHKRDWEIVDESNVLAAADGPTSTTIILQPRPPRKTAKLTGVARYENGEPARNRELTLWVQWKDGELRPVRDKTDVEGRFAVELPPHLVGDAGQWSGIVELSEGRSQEPQDRWMAPFQVVDGDEIAVEFRREHSLTVNLAAAIPLPAELTVQTTVSARPSHGADLIASQTRNGNALPPLTVRNLTPGRYQVHVQFREASHHNWYQDIVISADDAAKQHEVTINIPEVHFGSLTVAVQFPAGYLQNDRETVWMDATNAHGWKHIIDGVATFPIVPAGPVIVQCNERNGFVGTPIRGRIAANQVTTLGPIVIRPVEEAYGHVVGRVELADGTPALGAAVALQGIVSPSIGTDSERTDVNGSGKFRVSAAPDTPFLVANLKRCDLWPPGSIAEKASLDNQPGLPPSNPFETRHLTRLLVRPVSLTAGRQQSVDFVLPDVPFRDVTVHVPDAKRVHLALWTDLGGTWLQMEGLLDKDGRHVFQHVPDRPTRLFIMGLDTSDRNHWRHLGAAVVDVPAGESPVVNCDLTQTGTLRLRSKLPHEPGHDLSYEIRPADGQPPGRLGTLAGVHSSSLAQFLDEHGFAEFRLAPGNYVVTARVDGNEQEHLIETRINEVQSLELEFDAANK